MPQTSLELRLAKPDDRDRVLEWSNDPETRAASFHSGRVGQEAHAHWYAECLSGARTLFIAEVAGRPVGMARLEPIEPSRALVSLAIAPECRGQRLATPLLEALIAAAARRGLAKLIAQVRVENVRSSRVFEKAGFERAGTQRVAGAKAVRYELCLVDAAETETGRG